MSRSFSIRSYQAQLTAYTLHEKGLITIQERDAILDSDMALREHPNDITLDLDLHLINLNLGDHHLKTGEYVRLFEGRAEQIEINKLLGIKEKI